MGVLGLSDESSFFATDDGPTLAVKVYQHPDGQWVVWDNFGSPRAEARKDREDAIARGRSLAFEFKCDLGIGASSDGPFAWAKWEWSWSKPHVARL
jgi:hypothetical protein